MVILNKCSLSPSRCGQIHSHLSPWILTFQRFKRKKWLGILGSVACKAKYRSVKKQTTLNNNSQLMDQVTLGMVQVIANAESQMFKWYMGSLLVPGWKARTTISNSKEPNSPAMVSSIHSHSTPDWDLNLFTNTMGRSPIPSTKTFNPVGTPSFSYNWLQFDSSDKIYDKNTLIVTSLLKRQLSTPVKLQNYSFSGYNFKNINYHSI